MSLLNVDKVDPSSGTALEIGSSGDTITIPSGATIVNSGTATGFGITQTSFLPNAQSMIINGDMQVNQRGTSTAGITASNNLYTADRWRFRTAGSAVFTQTTEALTSGDAFTDGFSKSLKLDVTTANASPGVSDQMWIRYSFEGQDVQLLKKGTANAEKITVAFWIKATKTGTNILELYDESSTNRHCSAAYTVSSTDTWEYKIVTFPADTAGTALANTNAQTLDLYFWIAAGTNYTSGTLQTTWIDYSSGTTRDDRAVGQVNNADSTSNNFEITGVQLEVGEYVTADLPPFRHESYGNNLARCQRYYYRVNPLATANAPISMGSMFTTSTAFGVLSFPVNMRAVPTTDITSGAGYYVLNCNSASDGFDEFSASFTGATTTGTDLYGSNTLSQTSGAAGKMRFNDTAAKVAVTAEL
jgi:hypothetical protein